MSQEKSIPFDKVTNRLAKHFKSPDEMSTYFATIFAEPAEFANHADPIATPATRRRQREVAQDPAAVVLGDFVTFRNYLMLLGGAECGDDGRMHCSMDIAEARALWDAIRALKKVAETAPGQSILFTLAKLLPRKAERDPIKLAMHVLKVLTGEFTAELLKGLSSYFNAHLTN